MAHSPHHRAGLGKDLEEPRVFKKDLEANKLIICIMKSRVRWTGREGGRWLCVCEREPESDRAGCLGP